MHMEHATPVLDALQLKPGQQVLMASGRAAVVVELRSKTILFRYLDNPGTDEIELTRQQVIVVVRL